VFSCNWSGAQNFFQKVLFTDVNVLSLKKVISFAFLTLRCGPPHCALTWDFLQTSTCYSEGTQIRYMKGRTVAK